MKKTTALPHNPQPQGVTIPPVRQTRLEPTPAQVLGPFFLPNAPLKPDMIPANGKGDYIGISGQVLSVDGTLLAGAMVHVWLADTNGVYDNQDADGNAMRLSPAHHRLRCRINVNQTGEYEFGCLRPGNYSLSDDPKDMRPGHIHIKVEAPGHKTLVTQLYFIDDAYNEKDLPGEDFFQPQLVVHMKPALPTKGGIQWGVFNLVLEPTH